jgi:hypothetical protein
MFMGSKARPVRRVNNLTAIYSQKPQEALNLLATEERYWALFYMPLYTCFYTICWMY